MKQRSVVSVACILFFVLTGCAQTTKVDDGKIPITTTSDEARKEYLLGRDLAEKLRIQNSIEHFEAAVAKDPTFASAYFQLAQSSPTAKGFFDNLKKAVALATRCRKGSVS